MATIDRDEAVHEVDVKAFFKFADSEKSLGLKSRNRG
jgi:hypothetical protein